MYLRWFHKEPIKGLAVALYCRIICITATTVQAQCPANIDFENGNLNGWRFYTGWVSNQSGINTFSLNEIPEPEIGRQTLISATEGTVDPYGGFPTRSPNGSSYCVKLGNDLGGGQGEAISYEFTIPANRNTYSLIYYYAVVFQDPNHQVYEQPRMEIEITNVTDNAIISCASFSFIPYGSGLPGFFQASNQTGNTPVWCKDWSPVSINLDGNAGKTIRLLFRTGDCTFRRHFGYAYIDVDTDCSGEFVGASFCPDDKEITVKAPFGFMEYRWLNSDRTLEIGRGQNLILNPPPPSGTSVVVELTPYAGFGCPQTLTAKLLDNLNFSANAGADTLSCNGQPVRIGSSPRPGLLYSWSPLDGIANPTSSNPIVVPPSTANYTLRVSSPGGGCMDFDTVRITVSRLVDTLIADGKAEHCIGSGDSIVLWASSAHSIQWFYNGVPLPGETGIRYKPIITGDYYAILKDTFGCIVKSDVLEVNISSVPEASFSISHLSQCLIGNKFLFYNNSTNTLGTMQYRWQFGNTGSSAEVNPSYSFPVAGIFPVKLFVQSNTNCIDSTEAMLTIYPNPIPDFEGSFICEDLPYLPVQKTNEDIGSPIQYSWDFGEGKTSNLRNPPPLFYNTPGNYSVKLTVWSNQCPWPQITHEKKLIVQKKEASRRYLPTFAVKDYPLKLQARPVGVLFKWSPTDFLNNPDTSSPVYKGSADREYIVTIISEGGCMATDTIPIQVIDKVNIFVPNAFTPNGDGLNDVLRPVLMGISQLKYFRIFNRYGELIYNSPSEGSGWDGFFKGVPQPSQSYSWMVEGVGIDASVIQRKGISILIR